MSIRFIGKTLFPRQPAWKRERAIKHFFVALAVAVVFAAIVAGMMLLINSRPMR